MFRLTAKEAAKARGIKNYAELGREMTPEGATDAEKSRYAMIAMRLWRGKSMPTLPTLGLVCDALDCELSDLIVRNGKRKKK